MPYHPRSQACTLTGVEAQSAGGAVDPPSTRGRVVLGYDNDSLNDARALHWAAAEADARNVLLRVVGSGIGLPRRIAFARALRLTRERWPHVSIEAASDVVDAQGALVDETGDADLLVVSALGAAAAAQHWLVGSNVGLAARRSSCPVVVVRGKAGGPIRRIVVGIDGSSAAAAALDWAIAEAGFHRAEMLVVHAWEPGARHRGSRRSIDLDRADAGCVVDLAVRRCAKHLSVPVSGVVIEGSPALALVTVDLGADLVVVGSRGRSGFKTLLFGSVALSIAGHASCPVALIHPHLRDSSL